MRQIVLFLLLTTILCSCNNNESREKELNLKERELALREKELALNNSESTGSTASKEATEPQGALPFIGKKAFTIQPGADGTGTPHTYIEISKNGDCYFSFVQENQANGIVTTEKCYAGKYQEYLTCVFKKLGNERIYYRVLKEKIYQVDQDRKQLKNMDCCEIQDTAPNDNCPCASNYY